MAEIQRTPRWVSWRAMMEIKRPPSSTEPLINDLFVAASPMVLALVPSHSIAGLFPWVVFLMFPLLGSRDVSERATKLAFLTAGATLLGRGIYLGSIVPVAIPILALAFAATFGLPGFLVQPVQKPKGETLPETAIEDLLIDKNPDRAIYRSTDYGVTWVEVKPNSSKRQSDSALSGTL